MVSGAFKLLGRVSLFVTVGWALAACAAQQIVRQEAVRKSDTRSPASPFRYLVYLPPPYHDPEADSARWPVVFVLHGIAQVGSNLKKVASFGPAKQVEAGRNFPFVVISPQMANVAWSVERVVAFIEYCLDQYRVDRRRVYLTGTSLGGRAVWAVAAARPDLFAAIAPVAGWGEQHEAQATATIPAWLFHGAEDLVIPVSGSEEMYELHRAAGGDSELTVFPDLGHTIWDEVYGGERLYDWFLSHSTEARYSAN